MRPFFCQVKAKMTEEVKKSKTQAEDKTSVQKKPQATRQSQMKPKEWAEAEALWESGNITLAELSKRFGRAEETFSRHFASLGIKKGSKQAQSAEMVKEEVAKNIADDAKVLSTRIRESKEEHYKMTTVITKLVMNEVLSAQKSGMPLEAKSNNIKALKDAMSVVKMAREERWAILGMDDPDSINEDDLPELVISEMTAKQIEDMHLAQEKASQDFIDEMEGVLGSSSDDEDDENDVVTEGEG